ncbi:hypothetical protein HZC33_01155 [Candidatus Wolfebacteria bacterium]|nr:hypothetical protein [Candidatus Wolfebacteria bacterium]
MDGNIAIEGAFLRAEERSNNDLLIETDSKRQEAVLDFCKWPDWNNAPDFTELETL